MEKPSYTSLLLETMRYILKSRQTFNN